MDDLEQRLRDSLSRQVDAAPSRPELTDDVVRRGRRARHRRTVLAGAAAVVVLATAATLVARPGGDGPSVVATASPTPAAFDPQVLPEGPRSPLPMVIGSTLVDGDARVNLGGEGREAVAWESGVVVRVEADGLSRLLRWSRPTQRLDVVAVAVPEGVAVSGDGRLVAFIRLDSDAFPVRTVYDLVGTREAASSPQPDGLVAGAVDGFVGNEVLLTTGDGGPESGGVQAWNHVTGETRVVGPGRYSAVVTTHPAGLVALTQRTDGCHEVSELTLRPGLWSSCEALPATFSPDARLLLTTSADGLAVVSTRTGRDGRTLSVPGPDVTGIAWEDSGTLAVLVRVEGGRLQALRCVVTRDACTRAGPAVVGSTGLLVGPRPTSG